MKTWVDKLINANTAILERGLSLTLTISHTISLFPSPPLPSHLSLPLAASLCLSLPQSISLPLFLSLPSLYFFLVRSLSLSLPQTLSVCLSLSATPPPLSASVYLSLASTDALSFPLATCSSTQLAPAHTTHTHTLQPAYTRTHARTHARTHKHTHACTNTNRPLRHHCARRTGACGGGSPQHLSLRQTLRVTGLELRV